MIGIITVNKDTFTNPTLIELIKKFNSNGVQVIVFSPYHVEEIPASLPLTKYANGLKGVFFPKFPSTFLKYINKYFTVSRIIKRHGIKNIIAVDPDGLIIAGRIKKYLQPISISYASFEIFYEEEVAKIPLYAKKKKKEIYYSRYVSSVIIQDSIRKNSLIEENRLADNIKWFMIPNSPQQPVKFEGKDKLGLLETDTVYVHSGSVAEWSGISEIVEALEEGIEPGNFILIHSKSAFNSANEIEKRLINCKNAGAPVILHDAHFEDYDDYCKFLSAFDFGISLYKSGQGPYDGRNIREIGLSSGKFNTYMSLGMPTVLYNCEMFSALQQTYNMGCISEKNNNLRFHINNRTLSKTQGDNCIKLYTEKLNPSPVVDAFFNAITSGENLVVL